MIDFFREIKNKGNRIAFRFFEEDKLREVTYLQYYNDICECLENLNDEFGGSIEGKHIAILLHNSYETIVIISAVILGGAVIIPLNIFESVDNLKYCIDHADSDYLIVEDDNTNNYGDVRVGTIGRVCSLSRKKQYDVSFNMQDENKLALIIFTSGTTGRAKGVMVTLKALFHRPKDILPERFCNDEEEDIDLTTYLVFPLYHTVGFCCWLSWCVRGCRTYINKDIGSTLHELEKIKIDYACVPPSVMKLWYKALRRGGIERVGSIREICTGGAPIDKSIIEGYQSNGITYSQIYGMSEVFGQVTINHDAIRHVDSVGKVIVEGDVKVIDGEVYLKSWANMLGYYKNETATKECLVDGYVRTGDLGYLDDEGYLYLTGRRKNLIILSGGENVSPEEIESKLYGNPSIKECMVYQKKDRIYADIYAPELTEDEVKDYVMALNKTMPIYKRINHVEYKDSELEKTAIGKIKR